MKVYIIDLDQINHFDLLSGLTHYFQEKESNITLLLGKRNFKKYKNLTEENKNFSNITIKMIQYKDIVKLCFSKDRRILASCYSPSIKLFLLSLKKYDYLFLHNVNSFYNVSTFSPKQILKFIFRLWIRKRSKKLVVLNKKILDYSITAYNIRPDNIGWFPFKYGQSSMESDTISSNLIIYPGTIDFTKRNYDRFIVIAKNCPTYRFIILGTFNSNKDKIIWDQLINRQTLPDNLTYFESRVEDNLYKEYIRKAKFLFADLLPLFKTKEFDEMYGLTKETGVLYDSLLNNKPLLINKLIPLPPGFNTFAHLYNDEDSCIKILKKFSIEKIDSLALKEASINYYKSIEL